MRVLLFTFASLALTSFVVSNAFYMKKQFYPSVIYLTKSSPSMAVLYLQALVMVYLLGQIMKKVFFGQLRAAEIEHLIERSWYAVTETCLAFTVFRDDFNTRFVAMFVFLLFFKCFHWLTEDRIEFMERSPVISWIFHLRAICLLTLLAIVDILFIRHAYSATLVRGASVQLVFGFEYTVLILAVLSMFVKYILHTLDTRSENPWEAKAVYLLYSEFLLSGMRLFFYVLFLIIMMRVHTFPLFAIRPMYVTFRSFRKAFSDMVLSRRAIRQMNISFRNPNAEDLSSDNTCIICREDMEPGTQGGAKVLPCDHIFHAACLRSWFQRQQTCPTCRRGILTNSRTNNNSAPVQPSVPSSLPNSSLQHPSTNNPTNINAENSELSNINVNTFTPWMFSPTTFPVMPSPPADLGVLSDAELKAMECSGRLALQTRVEHLRKISTLLDAAVMQMQQYVDVVSRLPSSSGIDDNLTSDEKFSKQNTDNTTCKSTEASTSTDIFENNVCDDNEASSVRRHREGLLRRLESRT